MVVGLTGGEVGPIAMTPDRNVKAGYFAANVSESQEAETFLICVEDAV